MDSTQKEFWHKSLGLHLHLNKSAGELSMGDVDAFMIAYQEYTGSDDTRTLQAALKAGWVVEFTTPGGAVVLPADVPALKPVKVGRWAAAQINAVYVEARFIPND